MIAKFLIASIVTAAAFAATAPAHALISMNGHQLNGITNNGITNNGITNNGITNNGITNNGITNNGITNNGASVDGATVDREDSRDGVLPRPLFSIDGVIVPQ